MTRYFTPAAMLGLAFTGLLACRPEDPPAPKAAPVPVTSEVVSPAPFRASLNLLGTVEPAATTTLRTPAAGRLTYPGGGSEGLATGRRVRSGEPLFRVDSPELRLAAREAELAARATQNELERTRRGVDGGFMPEADLARRQIDHELAVERLEAARQALARLEVRAPTAGVLRVESPRAAGSEVAAETPIAELAADGALRLVAWATASDLDRLQPGRDVESRSSDGARLLGSGRLAEVDSRLDEGGVAKVVAVIDQDHAMPPAGSGVMLRVLLEAKDAVITVPVESLVIDGSLSSVFVLEASGKVSMARARLVQVGGRQGERVEVLEGLVEGEKVAVEGAELLADGLQAKDVTSDDGQPKTPW